MGFEEEVLSLLIVGFLFVMTSCIVWLGFIGYQTKNKNFGWFLGQLIFLSLSFYKFYSLIKSTYEIETTMASENASWLIGQSGLFWGVSMIFMCIGVVNLSKQSNKKKIK